MRRAAVGGVIAIAGALVARLAFHLSGIAVDDAYIHLNIARNWAQGFGPVFNPGERVEASTSPLWLSLLTLGLKAGMPFMALVNFLELASAAAAGAVVAMLAGEMAGGAAAVAAPVVLATLPAIDIWAGSGLETPLAVAGFGGCVLFARHVNGERRAAALGVLLFLLSTIRPETAPIGPVLLVLAVWPLSTPTRWRALGWGMGTFGALTAGLLLARHSYYGEWVPNTYIAKVSGIDFAHRLRGVGYVLKFCVLNAPLFMGLALIRPRERAALLPGLAAVAVLLAGTAWSGGDHFYFQRLAVPSLAVLCIPLAIAITQTDRRIRFGALALAALVIPIAIFGSQDRGALVQEQLSTQMLEEVGRALSSQPAGSLASIGIGAPAWFSQRPVLDMVGLADAHIARSPRFPGAKPGHEHGDADYVIKRDPELVLLFTWPTEKPIDDAEEMRQLSTLRGCCSSAMQLIGHPLFRTRYEPTDLILESGMHQRIWRRKLGGATLPQATGPEQAPP